MSDHDEAQWLDLTEFLDLHDMEPVRSDSEVPGAVDGLQVWTVDDLLAVDEA